MLVDKINQYLNSEKLTINEYIKYEIEKLAGFTFQRQFMEDNESKSGALRLSQSGRCARKLAYQYHGFEPNGKEIDGRARIIFWMGDLVEMIVTELARLAGVPLLGTGFRQLTVEYPLDDVVITGHPDGIILDNGEPVLLEVKSMSDYAFERFEKGVIDEGYIAQTNSYMDILKIKKCLFVAIDKNNGVMAEQVTNYDPKVVQDNITIFREVINSTKDDLPPRKYEPDKKGKLPWQCLYCPYWKICYPTAEKVLTGKRYQLFERKKK